MLFVLMRTMQADFFANSYCVQLGVVASDAQNKPKTNKKQKSIRWKRSVQHKQRNQSLNDLMQFSSVNDSTPQFA